MGNSEQEKFYMIYYLTKTMPQQLRERVGGSLQTATPITIIIILLLNVFLP